LQILGHEWGIKGDIDQIFYRCYYLNKKLELQPANQKDIKTTREHYIGLQTRIKLSEHPEYLHMQGEYLVGGNYQFHTTFESKFVELAYHQLRYKPSFLAQHYQGHYRSWDKTFESPKNHQ